MLQLEPTAPTAEVRGPAIAMMLTLLALGCGPRSHTSDEANAQTTPDLPAPPDDLPSELTEYDGILYGINYGAEPTRFVACDTGEVWEMTYNDGDLEWRWKGSCRGVFNRVRGRLDRSVDPPVVIIDEFLEARWCEPGDCVGDCVPEYDSCYQESERSQCDPLDPDGWLSCSPDSRCQPVRFYATEEPGWMSPDCRHVRTVQRR